MNPVISRVHAPTNVNGCTKYEHDPLNIEGSRVITRAGGTEGRTDEQTAQVTTIPLVFIKAKNWKGTFDFLPIG